MNITISPQTSPYRSPEEEALHYVRLCTTPEMIEEMELAMMRMPQIEVPVVHRISDGVYAREVTLPAGSIALGHAHKRDCINVMLTGEVSVMIDGALKRLVAPCTFIGKAGDRKVGYIHSESRWTTFHHTELDEIKEIEDSIIEKSAAFKIYDRNLATLSAAKLCIIPGLIGRTESTDAIIRDRQDFADAINEMGYSPDIVRAMSENMDDQTAISESENRRIFLSQSERAGVGVFAREDIGEGESVAPAAVNGLRTTAGRYINHSMSPNVRFAPEGNAINAVSLRPISAREEIVVNYRDSNPANIPRLAEQSTIS